jgi:hypothetical protein
MASCKGIAELGATGFNSFIINVDAQKNWENSKSPSLVSALSRRVWLRMKMLKPVSGAISLIWWVSGVGARDIHFMVSSGARKEPIMPKIETARRPWGMW